MSVNNNTSGEERQRSPFDHADDCRITFVRHNDNVRTYVDTFVITANGVTFDFQMMHMKWKKAREPWVFDSFSRDGRQVWSFGSRAIRSFTGNVYTIAYEGRTYALYVNHQGGLVHVVPFVDFLFGHEVPLDPMHNRHTLEEIDNLRKEYERLGKFAALNVLQHPASVSREMGRQLVVQFLGSQRKMSTQQAPRAARPDLKEVSQWDFFVDVLSRMNVPE